MAQAPMAQGLIDTKQIPKVVKAATKLGVVFPL